MEANNRNQQWAQTEQPQTQQPTSSRPERTYEERVREYLDSRNVIWPSEEPDTDDTETRENQGYPMTPRYGYYDDDSDDDQPYWHVLDPDEIRDARMTRNMRERERIPAFNQSELVDSVIIANWEKEGKWPEQLRTPMKWVKHRVDEGKCRFTLKPNAKKIRPWLPQRIPQE